VDEDNNGEIDTWTDWQEVQEQYGHTKGFAKQVERIPASLDLRGLPAGFGFSFEFRVQDTTENNSKPVIDRVTLTWDAMN
jgi:hypothetical protein